MKKLFYLTATLFTVFTLTSASKCGSDDKEDDPFFHKIIEQKFSYTVDKTDNAVIATGKGSVTGEIVNTYNYDANGVFSNMTVSFSFECGSALVANLVENYYRDLYSSYNVAVKVEGTAVKGYYSVAADDLKKMNDYDKFVNDMDYLYNSLKQQADKEIDLSQVQ